VRPGDRKPIPTVAEAVERAAAICDPDGHDDAVRALIESFEDDERPVTAVEDLSGELTSVARGIDPEGDSPAAEMTAAAAVWLSTNADQADDRPHVLREAARLHFGGDPPPHVADWLAAMPVA
jgi:hypothetical protein